MTRFRLAVAALCVTALAVTAVGTASQTKTTKSTKNEAVSGSLSIIGIWTGPEQKRFQAVLNGFKKLYPNVSVKYTSGGDNTPTILSTAIQGGNPPDLASIGQPGLLRDFANRGALKSIGFARATAAKNYTPDWLKLGTVKGKLYGLFFKGANKSTVWYSTAAFKAAGVKAPATWPALLAAANTLRASGTPGLLDRRRRRLDAHRPVREHLPAPGRSGQLRPADRAHDPLDASDGQGGPADDGAGLQRTNMYGGTSGALQTDFPTSVNNVWASRRRRRWCSRATSSPASRRRRRRRSRTTTSSSSRRSAARRPRSSAAATSSSCSRTAPPARRSSSTWRGVRRRRSRRSTLRATRPRTRTSQRAPIPTPLNRATAIQLSHARTFRFDLSDLAAVGVRRHRRAGPVQAVPGLPQDPSDVDGIAAQMEAAAKKAYK